MIILINDSVTFTKTNHDTMNDMPCSLEIVCGFINNYYYHLKTKCSEKVSLNKDDLKVKPLCSFSDLKKLSEI